NCYRKKKNTQMMNSSRKFQNDLTANKPDGKDVVSSEVSGDPKSKKPNGKSVDSSAEPLFFYFQKIIIPSEARWRAGRCRAKEYPGDDIPGAVTTKLSQGKPQKQALGMELQPPQLSYLLNLGFTAERSPLQEDTLLLFFSPFSFLSHCEILI
ncbi:LOW QUALITY PROTEIN: hypothetical protein HID58_045790, partial [Brassica napus]